MGRIIKNKCRECGGDIEIIGEYNGLIEVSCKKCGAMYSVEPDGLGMGGEEWVMAKMAEMGMDARF